MDKNYRYNGTLDLKGGFLSTSKVFIGERCLPSLQPAVHPCVVESTCPSQDMAQNLRRASHIILHTTLDDWYARDQTGGSLFKPRVLEIHTSKEGNNEGQIRKRGASFQPERLIAFVDFDSHLLIDCIHGCRLTGLCQVGV
jgi:hypothetical protein